MCNTSRYKKPLICSVIRINSSNMKSKESSKNLADKQAESEAKSSVSESPLYPTEEVIYRRGKPEGKVEPKNSSKTKWQWIRQLFVLGQILGTLYSTVVWIYRIQQWTSNRRTLAWRIRNVIFTASMGVLNTFWRRMKIRKASF